MRMSSEVAMIVAVLHDVVEDCRPEDKWTFDCLRSEGFTDEVLQALDGVTDRENESYEAIIERAAENPLCREVKIADLEDNMTLLRLGKVRPKDLERLEKYHRSWLRLTAGGA